MIKLAWNKDLFVNPSRSFAAFFQCSYGQKCDRNGPRTKPSGWSSSSSSPMAAGGYASQGHPNGYCCMFPLKLYHPNLFILIKGKSYLSIPICLDLCDCFQMLQASTPVTCYRHRFPRCPSTGRGSLNNNPGWSGLGNWSGWDLFWLRQIVTHCVIYI
jgi:hypothetical protein